MVDNSCAGVWCGRELLSVYGMEYRGMGSTRRMYREGGGEFCEFRRVCLEEGAVVVAVVWALVMVMDIIDL